MTTYGLADVYEKAVLANGGLIVFSTVGVVPNGPTRAVAVLVATEVRIAVYGTPAAESAAASVGSTEVAAGDQRADGDEARTYRLAW